MRLRKVTLLILILILGFTSCNNDDDNAVETVLTEPRDRGEQQLNEDIIIQDYLKTHFYTLVDNAANSNYKIVQLDTIAGSNSAEVSIWDSAPLTTKTVTVEDVDYTLYILNFDEGVETEPQPTFADSTFVTYRGELFYDYLDADGDGIPDDADVDADGDGFADLINEVLRTDSDGDGIADDSDADDDGTLGTDDDKIDSDNDGIIDSKDPVDNNNPNRRVFDSAVTPIWFDQLNVIEGWRESIVDFRGASGASENADGTVSYNKFGNYTVFIPSGLAYFSTGQVGIPPYAPLIFSIQLYDVNESDHDNDGIPSYLEDVDKDRSVFDIDDDTDADNIPNYLDTDDDGDGVPTINEDIDGDGDPTNDIGKNGIAKYLDPEETESN